LFNHRLLPNHTLANRLSQSQRHRAERGTALARDVIIVDTRIECRKARNIAR
jgi:hypothetical protein